MLDEQIIKLLNALTPIVGVLVSLGLVVKYVPLKVLAYIKTGLIPLFNTIVAFLMAFGPETAHAAVKGDIGAFLSVPAKFFVAYLIQRIFASPFFEHVLRPAADAAGIQPNTVLLAGKK